MLADFPKIIAAGQVWVAQNDRQVSGVLVQYETEAGFYIDTLAVLSLDCKAPAWGGRCCCLPKAKQPGAVSGRSTCAQTSK